MTKRASTQDESERFAHAQARREYLSQHPDRPLLTPCQLVCAQLSSMGLLQKQIAHELRLSPKTVNKHIEAANRKLKAHNPLEVARALLLLGLLEWDDFLQPSIENWREVRRLSYP